VEQTAVSDVEAEMKADFQVLVLCGLTVLAWGAWGFFGKLALQRNMAPLHLFLVEVTVSLLFAVVLSPQIYSKQSAPAWRDSWNVFGLYSGLGLAVGLVLYYFALHTGSATIVVPLTAVYPAVAVLLSVLILHERPSSAQWIGIACTIVGAMLLLSGPIATSDSAKETAVQPASDSRKVELAKTSH
jgi:transporter family protein